MTRLAPKILIPLAALVACYDGGVTSPTPEETPTGLVDGLPILGPVPSPSLGPVTSFDGGGVAITDFADATSTLEVGESGTILDVDVRMTLTHSWYGDLTIWVVSPSGTKVVLAQEHTFGDNTSDADFDDQAALAIDAASPTSDRSFQPFESLSAFNNEDQAGTWTLHVFDSYSGDEGTLDSWTLDIEVEGADAPLDSDGDGVADADDAFPDNPLEWSDNDHDGIGDNADPDDDNDGIPDDEDPDPLVPNDPLPSDFENLMIRGRDSGVLDRPLEGGGTFQSAVDACMDTRNHGQFQRCVAELANAWWRSGMISSRERGMITSAAASSG